MGHLQGITGGAAAKWNTAKLVRSVKHNCPVNIEELILDLHHNTVPVVTVSLSGVNAKRSITSPRQYNYDLDQAVNASSILCPNPVEPECFHFQMLALRIWISKMQQRELKQK